MPADKVIGQAIVFQKILRQFKRREARSIRPPVFQFHGNNMCRRYLPHRLPPHRLFQAAGQQRRQQDFQHISWEERQYAVAQADPQAVSRKHHEPHRPQNVAHRHAHGHGRAQPQVPFTPPLPKRRRQKCRQHIAYDISARITKERAHSRLEPGKYRYTHQSQQHIHPHRKQRAYGPQQPATQHHCKNGQVDGNEWQRNLYL